MRNSFNIEYLSKSIGMEKAAEIVSGVGFTDLDYSPDVADDNWMEKLDEDLKIFSKYGLQVHQTHAPFNRYNACGDKHMLCVDRMLQATKILNAKYMVTHGDEFDFVNMEYSFQNALNYNYELFAPCVEKALAMNIDIAFENVFLDGFDGGKPRFGSDVSELKALIDRFGSENVVCCWDFGHAAVAFGEDQPAKIRYMGDTIKCTHIHDNKLQQDQHLPPFLGLIDWEKCMSEFAAFHYNGNLSFEYVYGKIPEAVAYEFMLLAYKSGKYLEALMKAGAVGK